MLQQKLSGKSWLKMCSGEVREIKILINLLRNSIEKKFCYILLNAPSHQDLMKFCGDAAVTAGPPPDIMGYYPFFSLVLRQFNKVYNESLCSLALDTFDVGVIIIQSNSKDGSPYGVPNMVEQSNLQTGWL